MTNTLAIYLLELKWASIKQQTILEYEYSQIFEFYFLIFLRCSQNRFWATNQSLGH